MTRVSPIYILLLTITLGTLISGCDSDEPPPCGSPNAIYKVDFEFKVKNLRPLRDGESYSLWVRPACDSVWRLASDTTFNKFPVRDSTVIYGRFNSNLLPEEIAEAMVTIELSTKPITPGIALLKGLISNRFGLLSMNHLGDFSKTTGGVTFTSPSPDSDAYKHEFYLMKLDGEPKASIAALPVLHSGWRYGIWVADYEFFPYHEFLYGLFDKAAGHDSDSASDAYAFPGGEKKQRLDVPTGRIIVTLEPPFYGDSLRYKGAELLYVLQFNRFVAIERDKFYPMANVSGGWLPSAQITFTKR